MGPSIFLRTVAVIFYLGGNLPGGNSPGGNSLAYPVRAISKKLTQFEDKQVEINQQMKEKLREMEDRSRRNNLRIDGVNEPENESWKDTEQKTLEIFENTWIKKHCY